MNREVILKYLQILRTLPLSDIIDPRTHQRKFESLARIINKGYVGKPCYACNKLTDHNLIAYWINPRNIEIKSTTRVLLFFHGGGFTIGSTSSHSAMLNKLAYKLDNTVILSLDYRLAPINPFPDGLIDCIKCYLWVSNRHDTVYLGGLSAGGNLVLSTVLYLMCVKAKLPDKLLLLSPCPNLTDHKLKSCEKNWKSDWISPDFKLLSNIYWYGYPEETGTNPYLSPCFGNYGELKSKVLIQMGGGEVLCDDITELYNKMAKDGCNVRLETYDGYFHAFQLFNFKVADTSVKNMAKFLNA